MGTALAIGIAVNVLSPATATLGAPGNSLDVGTVGNVASATVADTNNGNGYTFGLRAIEGGQAGFGDVVLGLSGPGFSVCTVHGDSAVVDFNDVGNEGGVSPSFGCGRAYGQSVSVDGCTATMQAHAFQHSDHPLVNFLGTVPVDIKFKKTGPGRGTLEVTTRPPGDKIAIKGNWTGAVTMSTCPKCCGSRVAERSVASGR